MFIKQYIKINRRIRYKSEEPKFSSDKQSRKIYLKVFQGRTEECVIEEGELQTPEGHWWELWKSTGEGSLK